MFSSIKKRFQLSGGRSRLHLRRESSSVEVDTHSENATSSESAGRTLLIHGPVELKRGWRRQKRHLFLLSDLLLITNTNYKKHFKIKNKVPLNTIWIANCLDKFGEVDTSAKRSFVLGWPTVNFVATFSSSELKEKWHSSLQRCINLAKEKDQPESIPLKIITEDIKNCVCSVTVTVTNSDTVNNIINMSLPMLGITGSEKDYQLWVSSGKKEAPCPLTGHEHPYIIKMSHRPATGLLPQGPEGSTFQESPDTQGQFILKPRHPARNQQRKGQKSVRINFMGNWALRRGSSTCQDLLHVTPPSPKPGQLFGVSLGDVCERDSLPPSLLDMLCFLKQKGPLTEGIFRKSANMKLCRALKETLNAGDKVNLNCESVLVVACVLKDFLRNIPGSVFTSDLYAKWVSITDGENEEEKIAATQRLLDELPRANAELLRYLFGVLHNIQQHSSVNQMTAYNLATCIAPSILCLPNACSAELESDITRKISLVQFLIENCLQIFGEDIASLLGESSMHCDGSEKAADPSTDFGEDIASLLGESSMHCDGSEKAADPSTDLGEDIASLLGESSMHCDGSEKAADPSTDLGEDIASLLGESSMHCDGSEKSADPSTDFGEDIASLLGESSMHCDGSKKAADPSTDFGVSTKQPVESKPVRVIVTYKKAQLQNDAEAPRGVGPPSSLSAMLSVTED
ncbi:rho GTPase-activating protein 20-like isoform X1 [Equus caballus]|uniref:rho GTPase-activating protein 20-like isoform X1 n=1 Tax=Equus caballus TaxID=9796 RepID=UPI0038B36993